LLMLLMVAPGGLGELVYGVRDRVLRALARTKGLSVPSLAETAAFQASSEMSPAESTAALDEDDAMAWDGNGLASEDDGRHARAGDRPSELSGLLSCSGIDASYGQVQVLFGVD